jgi:hypothetical protein
VPGLVLISNSFNIFNLSNMLDNLHIDLISLYIFKCKLLNLTY